MAIAFRSAATGQSSANTSLVVNVPAGVQDGDFLVLFVAADTAGATITLPAGWTALPSSPLNLGVQAACAYRIASSEPASYTVTFSGSSAGTGAVMAAYVDTVSLGLDTSSGNTFAASTTHTLTGISAAIANEMLVCCFASDAGTSYTPPAGMTERADFQPSTSLTLMLCDVLQASAGASGDKSATAAMSDDGAGFILLIRSTLSPVNDAQSLGTKVSEAEALKLLASDADTAAANASEGETLEVSEARADAENNGANVSQAEDLFASEAKADGENLAAHIAESEANTVTGDDADPAGVAASEAEALAAAAAEADAIGARVSEAEAVQAIGDFPPARLRIDVYDPAGNKLNAGPITSVLGASYRMELDRIGSFAFRMPAGDEKAELVAQGNEVRIFREGEGLVFRGLVDRAEWVVDAEGGLVLSVSGSSIARRLAWENTLLGRSFEGATLAAAVTTLLAGSGWSAGSLDAPATTLLARFDGLSTWAALTKVAEVFGLHLREDPWDAEVDAGGFGAASGIVLQNVEAVSPALRENRRLAPIAGLTVLEESADVWNRVIPLGAGEGVNKLDLRHATRSSPYAVQSAVGPDGRTYWYLEDAASVAAYGRRTRVLNVKDALPLANSPAGFTAAANALYDVAASWLRRRKDPLVAYEVEAVGLRHLDPDGLPLFQVGDRLRLIFRGLARRSDGSTAVWKSVDASLWLMGFQRTFKDDGSDAWSLTVATVDRHEEDERARLAEVFEGMHALQVALRPYTYREIHGPERRSVDPTHSVTFVVDYDANVAYLHQALLSVAVKPVRTNATGAAAGGGSVATSGGGSAHSHTVSGQSASAGGGQTSSAESAHTHSVTGQSASAAGTHRHLMFAAIGTGPAATSTVPDVASTQLESATHYHNGTGAGFPNVGSHSHSLNNHRHLVINYQVAGKNSTGSANVSFWMILPDGQAFNPVYTYEAAADHTHTVTGATSSSGSSHAHTVADHTHAVTGTTSSAETAHTHSVMLPSHTHSLVFGIYEGAGPTASANVTVTINGVDRTAALGGPFDGDFLGKDITAYLQDAQGHPLRQRNTVVFTAGELLDLEIVCKSLVTATSLIPV
jgi:hypothetical protein